VAKAAKLSYPERKKERMYAKVDAWQAKLAGALVILVLCIQPLYLHPERYVRLTWHKFIFFVVYMVCILIVVAVIWAYRMTRSPRLTPRGKLNIADWAILGFAAVTIISALFSPFQGAPDFQRDGFVNVWVGVPEPEGRYDGAITQLLYVAIFLIVSRWYVPRVEHFMLFGISAVFVALIGILQFYGMDFLRLWPNNDPRYQVENFYNIFFRTTLGNTNIVSTYVSAAVLLCGFLYVRMKSKWQPLWLAASALNFWMMELANADSGRVGVLVATILALPFVVENKKVLGRFLILGSSWLAVYALQMLFYESLILDTRTTGSLLPFVVAAAALVAIGVILTKLGNEIDPEAPIKWKRGAILVAAIIAAGLISVELLGRQDAETRGTWRVIYQTREILHGNVQDHFVSNRIYIWRNALRAFPNNPIIGSGPDTFYHAFPPDAHGFEQHSFDTAHNEYIQILICQGILGLVSYLVFLVTASVKAIPKAFRSPQVMTVLVAFVGYCVQAFANIRLPITSQLLWVFAGMLANRKFREAQL
jgi:O-antigen ligase